MAPEPEKPGLQGSVNELLHDIEREQDSFRGDQTGLTTASITTAPLQAPSSRFPTFSRTTGCCLIQEGCKNATPLREADHTPLGKLQRLIGDEEGNLLSG